MTDELTTPDPAATNQSQTHEAAATTATREKPTTKPHHLSRL